MSKEKKGWLPRDGLPRSLTDDKYVELVIEYHQEQRELALAEERRKLSKEEYDAALAEWKSLEATHLELNEKRREEWKVKIQDWETAKAKAKQEKKRFKVPRQKLGELLKASPQPKRYEGPELVPVNPAAPDEGEGDNEGGEVFDLNVEGESSDGGTGSGSE